MPAEGNGNRNFSSCMPFATLMIIVMCQQKKYIGAGLVSGMFMFCILLAGPVIGQSRITGRVFDKNDGHPLPEATVKLEPGNHSCLPGPGGEFEFRNIAAGTYTLTVTYVGYAVYSQEFNLTGDKQLEVPLSPTTYTRQEIIVNATRVQAGEGFSFTNINKDEIRKNNSGTDIPYLLELTPSLVTTSDAGTGIGYTGMRIRGSDGTRINVSLNGVPLNDAESQSVYFVDLPDLASSLESIQVQRGVGSSANGAGAFGGSINLMTNKQSVQPYAESSHAYGSFHTVKNNLSLGTGLLNKHWGFEGRLSRIKSDGYMDRAWADLKSWYASGGYYSGRAIIKLTALSGKEITYQAWNGVPEYLLNSNRTYNAFMYENQVDNYKQDHYQLLFGYDFLKDLHLQVTLHQTRGKGYYEEYKTADDAYGEGLLSFYGLPDLVTGPDTVNATDLVRRKWLDNNFYGAVWALSYENQRKFRATFGGAWNRYLGNHYNNLVWMRYAGSTGPDYVYESDDAVKTDFNVYLKGYYEPVRSLGFYADIQFRQVEYRFSGFDTAFTVVPQEDILPFFNPKFGLNWNFARAWNFFASVSRAGKEPSRDDYTESISGSRPGPEKMTDVEAGMSYVTGKLSLSLNYYWMYYDNQLVLTGKVNDVGNYTRTNVPFSYRQGFEAVGGFNIGTFVSLKGMATVSENKIRSFEEYIDNYDDGTQKMEVHKRSNLAFSPVFTAAGTVTWKPLKNLDVDYSIRHVGKQYLDNTSDEQRKINDYTVSDIRLSYVLGFKSKQEIQFSFTLSNIFSKKYVSNGYTFSYISGGSSITENYYYPQALVHGMGQVTFRF